MVQDVLHTLKGITRQSIADQCLKSQALILLADLKLQACSKPSQLADMVTYPQLYITAHEALLSQVSYSLSMRLA